MSRPVIFVVDDNEQDLRLIESDLEREYRERYRILGARSGQEALKKLRLLKNNNEPVALLVAYYEMPQMNGIEFLEQAVTFFPDARRVLLPASRASSLPEMCATGRLSGSPLAWAKGQPLCDSFINILIRVCQAPDGTRSVFNCVYGNGCLQRRMYQ